MPQKPRSQPDPGMVTLNRDNVVFSFELGFLFPCVTSAKAVVDFSRGKIVGESGSFLKKGCPSFSSSVGFLCFWQAPMIGFFSLLETRDRYEGSNWNLLTHSSSFCRGPKKTEDPSSGLCCYFATGGGG